MHRCIPGAIAAALVFVVSVEPLIAQQRENPVVRENRREGATDWALTKTAVDEETNRSRAIEGYCSQMTYAHGDVLTIFVSTNPATEYDLDLYRMGYYGGAGARKVLSVKGLVGATQPEPLTGLRNLKYCEWAPAFSIEIPEAWLSGVYLGKLSAAGDGPQSYVVFTLRDDRQAEVVFQVSDITWQTYNRWPSWHSLYDFGDNQWETRTSNDIGFQRPYARYHNELPISHANANKVVGSGEFLMWEFQLAYWLEREGYDVTYISNVDTHRRPNLLTRAKAFVSVGHDEYWTREMYENVAAARDSGVSLLFLSGNSVSGEINMKDGPNGEADDVISRNRMFPDEEELMGARSYGVGLADWTVTDETHWLFEGTGMKNGDSIKDLVGWEYHGPPLREDATLKVVARGPVRNMQGVLREDRQYTALFYDGPRGNFVFNAATCWWSLPISSPPGVVPAARGDFSKEDERVQRMTRNLLARAIGGRRAAVEED